MLFVNQESFDEFLDSSCTWIFTMIPKCISKLPHPMDLPLILNFLCALIFDLIRGGWPDPGRISSECFLDFGGRLVHYDLWFELLHDLVELFYSHLYNNVVSQMVSKLRVLLPILKDVFHDSLSYLNVFTEVHLSAVFLSHLEAWNLLESVLLLLQQRWPSLRKRLNRQK